MSVTTVNQPRPAEFRYPSLPDRVGEIAREFGSRMMMPRDFERSLGVNVGVAEDLAPQLQLLTTALNPFASQGRTIAETSTLLYLPFSTIAELVEADRQVAARRGMLPALYQNECDKLEFGGREDSRWAVIHERELLRDNPYEGCRFATVLEFATLLAVRYYNQSASKPIGELYKTPSMVFWQCLDHREGTVVPVGIDRAGRIHLSRDAGEMIGDGRMTRAAIAFDSSLTLR